VKRGWRGRNLGGGERGLRGAMLPSLDYSYGHSYLVVVAVVVGLWLFGAG